MTLFLVAEALRDLRRAGRVAVSAVLLITLSLTVLGLFWLVSANLERVVAEWRDRVRIIVYLRHEPAADDVAPLVERVRALPGVSAVRYVGKAEALRSLRRVLGKDASVVDQLPANPLPASLEITPAGTSATPDAARALLARLSALPEAEEVAGSIDWVDRLAHWRRLLELAGLAVGAVLGLAAILAVTTATTLVLHQRRHETEIMRLVGAPETAVRLPLLLGGMLQGLLGAGLAAAVLFAGYRIAAPRLEPLLTLTLGLPQLRFLPRGGLGVLVLSGALLGGFGGWLARGRGPA